MARAVFEDPYHNFRFQLVEPTGQFIRPLAGFTTVSMPEVTISPQEYREGIDYWTRKYPGYPEVGEVTMERGIFRRNSDFFAWIERAIYGGIAYCADVILQEFHIADEGGGVPGLPGGKPPSRREQAPSRITRLSNAWATTVKPTADKDATGTDVSLESMTLAIEEMTPMPLTA